MSKLKLALLAGFFLSIGFAGIAYFDIEYAILLAAGFSVFAGGMLMLRALME